MLDALLAALLDALLAALLDALLEALSLQLGLGFLNACVQVAADLSFFRHVLHFLRIFQLVTVDTVPQHQQPEPIHELLPQPHKLRRLQLLQRLVQNRPGLVEDLHGLRADHKRHDVARRQFPPRIRPHVDHDVTISREPRLPRLLHRVGNGSRRQHIAHSRGCVPAIAAVVHNDRQDRYEPACSGLLLLPQLLVDSRRRALHPQGHVAVHLRLEFQHHHDVQMTAGQSALDDGHLPQQVDVPAGQIRSDVFSRHQLGSCEIQAVEPLFDAFDMLGQVSVQQISQGTHQSVERLVGLIVPRPGPTLVRRFGGRHRSILYHILYYATAASPGVRGVTACGFPLYAGESRESPNRANSGEESALARCPDSRRQHGYADPRLV